MDKYSFLNAAHTAYFADLYDQYLKDPDAVLSRKGRHIFLVPWRDYTLVGVWHLVFDKDPDSITVSSEELDSYIDEINAAIPALELKLDDITMVNTGL